MTIVIPILNKSTNYAMLIISLNKIFLKKKLGINCTEKVMGGDEIN